MLVLCSFTAAVTGGLDPQLTAGDAHVDDITPGLQGTRRGYGASTYPRQFS